MQKLKNQNGFAVVEALLAILLLAAVGAAGYFAYKDHQNSSAKTVSSTTQAHRTAKTSSTVAQPANPYAGWKSYALPGGISFMYPANWTLNPNGAYLLASPVDSSTGLQFNIGYTKFSGTPPYLDSDTVVSNTPLGISAAKPLYMLTLDYNNSSGNDIDGLYVMDENAVAGASVVPNAGFTPSSGGGSITFDAILEPPNAQNDPGEKLALYQGSPYYQTVISIFKSIK